MPDGAPRLSTRERLEEYFKRLSSLPLAENSEMALQQLQQTLDKVEDELRGVEKQSPPPAVRNLGERMYLPLDDHILRKPDGSILALSRSHRIEIEASGHVRIINKVTNQVEFQK